MSRIFDADGKHVAVTLLGVLPGKISRLKTRESNNKYNAVVVELASNKEKKKSKFSEFTVDNPEQFEVGQETTAKLFDISDTVEVVGKSKGKGFAGTIKRHHFHRGPVSHGSHNVRQPGSIGGGYPQRVVPGRKMPGRLGGNNSTIKNLKIIHIYEDDNILAVSGAVPGPANSIIKIKSI